MRRTAAGVAWIVAAVLAVPATAQHDLSEAASRIKLKRPEGEAVVIDKYMVGSSGRPSGGAGDGEILLEAIVESSEAAQSVVALMLEVRAGDVFYDDGWRARVDAAADRLGDAGGNVLNANVPERFAESYETAQRGIDQAGAGIALLRNSMISDRPFLTGVSTRLAEGISLLDDAAASLRVVLRKVDAEKPAQDIEPIAASLAIEASCGGRFAEDSEGYRDCVAGQEAARDAIRGRFAFSTGLDESKFNTIRNACASEWPRDLVQRNECERRRIVTAGGR
ncbi:MAG: hypothetical protein ACC742_05805 [Thermoanaerobaculales bacterium]